MFMRASDSALLVVWLASLAILLVVTVVVGILLALILKQALQIDAGAAKIWTTGKLIANNTILITLLGRTNQIVAGILTAAGGIAAAVQRIEHHATTCPGCPACALPKV